MDFWTVFPFIVFVLTLIFSRLILGMFSVIFAILSEIFKALSQWTHT